MPNSTTNTGRQTRAGTKNSTAVTPGATVVMQVPAAAGNNAADFLSDLRKGGDFSEEKFKQLLAFSEQVAKDNQQLHETVDIMERNGSDDGRRHATSEKAKNEMKVLHRNHTYRNYKFGNEDEEKEAVLEILYHIKHPDLDDDDHKAVFFNTWKPLTASFMGAQRSYAQGRVKDSITSFVEKNGVYPPFMWIVDLIMRKDDYFIPPHTDEDLKAARGNAKKKIEDELKTFAIKVLFAEHFQTSVLSKCQQLPAIVFVASNLPAIVSVLSIHSTMFTFCLFLFSEMLVGDKFWGKKTLFYSTISEYKVLDHAGKPVQLFTASTEAFLLILCDNNWDKWRAMCKWWASKNDWKAELPVLLSAAELAAKRIKEKNPDLQQDPIAVACHTAKYTDKNAGQTKEGSTFSEAGLKQFRRFAKDIKRNRKKRKEAIVKFDKQVLELVRTKKKITGKTHEEQLLGSNRKRKPGKVAAKPRKQFRLWAIDDEDGDISESDGEEVQSNGEDSTDET